MLEECSPEASPIALVKAACSGEPRETRSHLLVSLEAKSPQIKDAQALAVLRGAKRSVGKSAH